MSSNSVLRTENVNSKEATEQGIVEQKLKDKVLYDTLQEFLGEHNGEDLSVYYRTDGTSNNSIGRFQISGMYLQLIEEDESLNICEYGQPMLIPDMVSIPYKEVDKCYRRPIVPGEEQAADVLEITLETGIIIELGFLLV